MLGHVTHESLRPLVYPLVQVMLGVVHLQPSARHYPLRLHIVRTLLELSEATRTFIPVAPYLLEVSSSSVAGGQCLHRCLCLWFSLTDFRKSWGGSGRSCDHREATQHVNIASRY